MALLAFLSKVKALTPVAVVGGAIAITINLLTASSPSTNNLLDVKAEEDIKKTEYQEVLEEEEVPETPEEPKEPEMAQEESPAEDSEDSDESEEEEGEGENEEAEESPQQEAEQEEQNQNGGRMLGNGLVENMLRDILEIK